MTDRFRVVLDTNVIVSAFLSRNPTSPTKEILRRWEDGEFLLLISKALLHEIIEKLIEKRIDQSRISGFARLLARVAEKVDVPAEVDAVITDDPDDDHVLACAVTGRAHFLVTYDPHFDCLDGEYRGVRVLKALPFLRTLRGDRPPDRDSTSKGTDS